MPAVCLLLAQDPLTSAAQGLSLLEKIQAGGVPLICLVLSCVFGYAFYKQLRQNTDTSKAHLEEVRENGKSSLSRQEALMREMLERDRQAQETIGAVVTTVSGFTSAIRDQQASCEQTNALVRDLSERIKELERRGESDPDSRRRGPR
jgi:peptidoglycan hydrolase CwlO-like protein